MKSSHNNSNNENYHEIKNYNINKAYSKLLDNISNFEIDDKNSKVINKFNYKQNNLNICRAKKRKNDS